MSGAPIQFGVNVNNREPLIAADYDLSMLLDLSETVEASGAEAGARGEAVAAAQRGTELPPRVRLGRGLREGAGPKTLGLVRRPHSGDHARAQEEHDRIREDPAQPPAVAVGRRGLL